MPRRDSQLSDEVTAYLRDFELTDGRFEMPAKKQAAHDTALCKLDPAKQRVAVTEMLAIALQLRSKRSTMAERAVEQLLQTGARMVVQAQAVARSLATTTRARRSIDFIGGTTRSAPSLDTEARPVGTVGLLELLTAR